MTNSDVPQSLTPGKRAKVKKASAASLGVTVLLVIGYLIASWLGIPLDGITSTERGVGPEGSERPVAVATEGRATDASPGAGQHRASGSNKTSRSAQAEAPTASPLKIANVTVRNLEGKVAFQGTVDLTPTMRRIDAGQLLERFRNDGTTFQNRERRLPLKERGYYKEFVHPTPKLGGPGPQRIVTGKQGEAYYTFDHYKTFQKIR